MRLVELTVSYYPSQPPPAFYEGSELFRPCDHWEWCPEISKEFFSKSTVIRSTDPPTDLRAFIVRNPSLTVYEAGWRVDRFHPYHVLEIPNFLF